MGGHPAEVPTDVTDSEDFFRLAEEEASKGKYKEAYNLLGRAPWRGGAEDRELRHRRGQYAFNVAHERLNHLRHSPSPKLTLIKAGCWLSRSEAYLLSAAEDADESTRRQIEEEVQRTKREQERFRRLCAEFGEDLFVSPHDELDDE